MPLTLPLFSTLLCSYTVIFNWQYFVFGTGYYSEDWAGRDLGETTHVFEVRQCVKWRNKIVPVLCFL